VQPSGGLGDDLEPGLSHETGYWFAEQLFWQLSPVHAEHSV